MTTETENHLRALRNFLGRMTAASRRSHGWTFDDELAALDRAIAESAADRNGLEKAAKVIEAGEKERRELITRISVLTRDVENLVHNGMVLVTAVRQYATANGDVRTIQALAGYAAGFESYLPKQETEVRHG